MRLRHDQMSVVRTRALFLEAQKELRIVSVATTHVGLPFVSGPRSIGANRLSC